MSEEEREPVETKRPFIRVTVARAAELECSQTCGNYGRGCGICDGKIMYAPAEE